MSKSVALRATGGGRLARPRIAAPVRVRRRGDGSAWRRFDTKRKACRAIPELYKHALDALLDAREFEVRRLMSGSDAMVASRRRRVEVRRIGEDEWRRFDSVSAAAAAFKVNASQFSNLLNGYSTSSSTSRTYEARYAEQTRPNTLDVRRRGGTWRGFPSNTAALAAFPELTMTLLRGLVHESHALFEAEYVEAAPVAATGDAAVSDAAAPDALGDGDASTGSAVAPAVAPRATGGDRRPMAIRVRRRGDGSAWRRFD